MEKLGLYIFVSTVTWFCVSICAHLMWGFFSPDKMGLIPVLWIGVIVFVGAAIVRLVSKNK